MLLSPAWSSGQYCPMNTGWRRAGLSGHQVRNRVNPAPLPSPDGDKRENVSRIYVVAKKIGLYLVARGLLEAVRLLWRKLREGTPWDDIL